MCVCVRRTIDSVSRRREQQQVRGAWRCMRRPITRRHSRVTSLHAAARALLGHPEDSTAHAPRIAAVSISAARTQYTDDDDDTAVSIAPLLLQLNDSVFFHEHCIPFLYIATVLPVTAVDMSVRSVSGHVTESVPGCCRSPVVDVTTDCSSGQDGGAGDAVQSVPDPRRLHQSAETAAVTSCDSRRPSFMISDILAPAEPRRLSSARQRSSPVDLPAPPRPSPALARFTHLDFSPHHRPFPAAAAAAAACLQRRGLDDGDLERCLGSAGAAELRRLGPPVSWPSPPGAVVRDHGTAVVQRGGAVSGGSGGYGGECGSDVDVDMDDDNDVDSSSSLVGQLYISAAHSVISSPKGK